MTDTTGDSPYRSDNRRQELMAAAAHLFNQRGYDATSMRDIAREAGMLAGSMYYHFPSKDDLIIATYEEGTRLITEAVVYAIKDATDPWDRLDKAAIAHMNTLFGGNNFSILLKLFLYSLLQHIYKFRAFLTPCLVNKLCDMVL